MPTREEFLEKLWSEVIDPSMCRAWIDNVISESERRPDSPFADAGVALKRVLAHGVDPHDLRHIARAAVYEAVFSTLYMLDDPGVDGGEVFMLHESLLSADPSGREGRPGSDS
jgi:hypothetical protein